MTGIPKPSTSLLYAPAALVADVSLSDGQPTQVSKARIKRLRGTTSPAYRLRVDNYRAFYDVDENAQVVTVHGVVAKEHASQWLANFTGGANP